MHKRACKNFSSPHVMDTKLENEPCLVCTLLGMEVAFGKMTAEEAERIAQNLDADAFWQSMGDYVVDPLTRGDFSQE